MPTVLKKKVSLVLAISAGFGACATVKAVAPDTFITSFTPGDLVVLRGGDGSSNPNPAGGTTVTIGAYLDEYTPAGAYQGTMAIPQSTSGSNNTLTISNLAQSHEGILTLSDNGNWLTFGGYETAPTSGTSGASVSNQSIGEISQDISTLNTSTLISPTSAIRAAITVDGNEFWVSNNPSLQYINGTGPTIGTGPTATATLLSATYNTRALQTVKNTLVTGSGSSSLGTHGVWQLGSSQALPTAGTPSKTLITSGTQQDGTDFIFANEPGDTLNPGLYQGQYNVLYSVGGASGSATINKYEYNGNAFVLLNSETPVQGGGDSLIGITDIVSGSNVDLYYTDNTGIYELVDSNNAGALLPGSGALLGTDSAVPGEYDYGIALAPTTVPEPGSMGPIAVAAGALLGRRRRTA